VTEASLAIARKVVLCVGLLVGALLFLFPHWRVSVGMSPGMNAGRLAIDQDIGRGFIAFPPVQIRNNMFNVRVRINYVRQITEVAIALLLTFGLLRALKLKKPVGDRKHDAED
jgi:hypothetical protein